MGDLLTDPDITICTVFHDAFTRQCLEMNVAATDARHPSSSIPWIAVDNSDGTLPPMSPSGNVTVVPGAPPDPAIPASVRGSYHHGSAINRSIEPVATRWALVLDVDFFVVPSRWAEAVTASAGEEGLSFFGTTWHPRWFNKFRYFPSVHFLLIDFDRVDAATLDFRPDLLDGPGSDLEPPPSDHRGDEGSRLGMVARNLATIALLRDRRVIGTSRDTGFRLFERYARDRRHRSDHLQPVYRPGEQFEGPRYALGTFNRLVEKLLPERLCYFPKRKAASSPRSFQDLGAYDAFGRGWEEFLWRGRPFAFHFRGYQNRGDDARTIEDLERALASFEATLTEAE